MECVNHDHRIAIVTYLKIYEPEMHHSRWMCAALMPLCLGALQTVD